MGKTYEKCIVDVVDFPKKGIIFKDITPLFENPCELKKAFDDLEAAISTLPSFNKIVCADARGFLFGTELALRFNVPLVLARKPGKLPRPGVKASYTLEYGENTLVVSEGSIKSGDKVVIVDDLLATGGSANAIKEIALKSNASVSGVATLIELDALDGRKLLKDTPVVSIIHY